MQTKLHRSSTLIEVMSYLVLLSILIGTLAAIELTARRSLKEQVSQFRLHKEYLQLSQQFRNDVLQSVRSLNKLHSPQHLELITPQHSIHYTFQNQTLSRQLSNNPTPSPLSPFLLNSLFSQSPQGKILWDFHLHIPAPNAYVYPTSDHFSLALLPRKNN
jgi:hypothetical protein